jgi:UDP-N-acetylmuramyl tripeptide synthase
LILDKTQKRLWVLAEKNKGKTLFFNDSAENLSYINLKGSFNAKNVNCALLAAEHVGIDLSGARESLKDFEYAYGRGEKISYMEKEWQIFLAKNPESLNQNLKLLLEGSISYDSLLYILNDNVPDGLDVSWVYDVDPRLLRDASRKKEVYVAGTRALDMAVRLQYAGVDVKRELVQESLLVIVRKIVADEKAGKIVVLPNYSSMLEFRKVLTGRKIP